MKKLYKKGKVHPSPPPPTIADRLSLLPATILSLTAALSLEDKEVLAYLISCCSSSSSSSSTSTTTRRRQQTNPGFKNGAKEHDPTFECNCFRCYMYFWARWDTSPNRQLIHEIIEAYEEELGCLSGDKEQGGNYNKKVSSKRGRMMRKKGRVNDDDEQRNGRGSSGKGSINLNQKKLEFNCQCNEEEEEEENKAADLMDEAGSIRKIVSFIGDSIWGVWNRD